jgi:hypothetical protein
VNDEEALVRALVNDLEDEALLSVFFDWLEDNGTAGGIARLSTRTWGSREQSHVFVSSATQVTVQTMVAGRALWKSLLLPGLLEDGEGNLAPYWKRQAAERCQSINAWDKLRSLVLAAPSCGVEQAGVYGVSSHTHSLRDREGLLSATWTNPRAAEHPVQVELLLAYGGLIALADLLPSQVAPPPKAPTTRAASATAVGESESDDSEGSRRMALT